MNHRHIDMLIDSNDTNELVTMFYGDLTPEKLDIEDVMNDAWVQDVEIDWDHEYDDWWTSRKGGYEVTYKIDEK